MTTKTISIIIPALNEAECLPGVLQALRDRSAFAVRHEIIVVDGGSTDGTGEVAREAGAEVIFCPDAPRGRAFLLNRGAARATGDIFLFLDADSLVPERWDAELLTALRLPGCVGGAFEFKLHGREFGLRVVEFINRLRYRIWPWYYGDQGIFVRRDIFEEAGGYPEVRLMEASDFCRKVERRGELALVHQDMLTSARRFLDRGIYRVLGFDIRMWWRNLTGRDVEQFARQYWSTHQPPQ
ncbi:MAG: TIGR04283 family arsenosugar biosynthesis glycosyltransferase [Candidatus Omnitrophica bacterium]|nr:TIGR04283 family arsenosugar biosynthesis glycosyltransferase [Candidatus Omnitrophota bacterium]MCB9720401.1 TIGR04283 family arsenosugar biosynthesis glycosyltransferase [Candidatus Omnitrophota bacterium]